VQTRDLKIRTYALDARAWNGARLWSKTQPQRVADAHRSEPVDALRLVLGTRTCLARRQRHGESQISEILLNGEAHFLDFP